MPRRRGSEEPEQVDLFSVAPDALALHRSSEHQWPDADRFPHNRPGQRVRDTVRGDLLASDRPMVVAGFTSIGELVDLADAWLRSRPGEADDDGQVRVLLGSEPFSTSRRAFASPMARFTDEVRRYWLEERGISLDLSGAVVAAIEAIHGGQLTARAVVGDRPLHAKIFVGERAATLGSSNFTHAGLATNLEMNARFDVGAEPARHRELVDAAERLWDVGSDWTAELRALLEALLRVAPWQEALAAACAELLEGEWARRYLEVDHTAEGYSLWPSQRVGIAQALWIIENVGSVLVADATGSGKTRMGAHLVRAIRDRLWSTGRVRRDLTVLVCPPAVEEIWRAESIATGLSLDTVSHGLLSRAAAHGSRLETDAVQRGPGARRRRGPQLLEPRLQPDPAGAREPGRPRRPLHRHADQPGSARPAPARRPARRRQLRGRHPRDPAAPGAPAWRRPAQLRRAVAAPARDPAVHRAPDQDHAQRARRP